MSNSPDIAYRYSMLKLRHLIPLLSLAFISSGVHGQESEDYGSKGCLLAFGDLESPVIPGQKPEQQLDLTTLQRTWDAPLQTEQATFEDHYNWLIDSIKLSYEFVDVEANREAGSDVEVWNLVKLAIRDKQFDLPCGLNVGQSASRFEEVLGKPSLNSTETLIRYEWLKVEKWKEDNNFFAEWHATITLDVSPEGDVTQINWYWFSD